MSKRKAGGQDWLRPHKLEYVPLNEELAVVRVVAGLERGVRPPTSPALVAGAPHTVVRAPVLGSVSHRPSRRMRTSDHLLWRVTFALPLELIESPQTLFALAARDYMPTRLPVPELSSFEALCRHWELGARGAGLISGLALRRAAALGTAVAVAGSSVLPPALALGAGPASGQVVLAQTGSTQSAISAQDLAWAKKHRHHHHLKSHSHASTPGATSPTSTRSTSLRPTSSASTPGPKKHPSPAHPHRSAKAQAPTSHQGSGGLASPSAPATPAPSKRPTQHGHHRAGGHDRTGGHHRLGGQTLSQAGGSGLSTISPTPPATLGSHHHVVGARGQGNHATGHHGAGSMHRHHHHGAGSTSGHHQHHPRHPGAGLRQLISGGGALPPLKPARTAHHHRPTAHKRQPVATPTPSSLPSSSNSFWTTGTGMSSGEVALLSHLSGLYVKGLQPPPFLIPIYKAAGKRFHIPWQVLAGINSIETDYGRNLNISSAGAEGWMQFMPSTWAEYGISVKGNGPPNPYDPTDAIFSAAHYLAANGGAHHLRKAIFAYNHATWYVDSVLWRAGIISEHAPGTHHLGGYAMPLDGKYMKVFGRTDDGLDIEDAPDGAAVYSMTPGVVTAVADDPGGFGPNYPVVRVTKGPLTGQYIYYGHVAASLVKVGQHVMAGQPIAVMGHTGDAASLGHGHIEIGFSDSAGDPLNHHGAAAWTPSGAAMRHVLVALAAGFHIKVR